MTDVASALRRLLEQQRESGLSEVRLETLTREDALRLAGAAEHRSTPSSSPPTTAGLAQQQLAERGDWRAVLHSTDAGPASPPTRPKPPTVVPESVTGITVPTPTGDIFGGPSLDTLDAVAESIRVCVRCPLSASATNPVPGEGNAKADLMFVGEAPGATEDQTGRPFVGQAGQLLTKIIEAIGFKREEVFICNVLKHRPPGNRNPLPDEVTACSPYLRRQIELVKPKVIVALGTFAAQTLLDTKLSIGKLREQVHRYHGVPLIVTYHPAALLRNPAWKRPTWEDVQHARRILDNAVSGEGTAPFNGA